MYSNKEEFIANVFDSVKNIKKIEPSNDLYLKINNQIYNNNSFSNSQLFAIAASILIIISINIFSILENKNEKVVEVITPISDNQLY